MENLDKEVYFGVYCPQCRHWEEAEWAAPCADCLKISGISTTIQTRKPPRERRYKCRLY